MRIVFKQPDADSPGYLIRAKKALRFKSLIDSGEVSEQVIDEMIEFLLPYISEPVDRNEARASLLEASENEFNKLMDQFAVSNPTQPKLKEGS